MICASLLRQLAQRMKLLPSQVDELYNRLQPANKRPTKDQLISLILSILPSFVFTYIVIDAFDEYVEGHRMEFLTVLSQLQVPSVHILITSRPHIDEIKKTFSQWPHVEIKAHHEDIYCLFDQKLQRNSKSKRRITADFQEEIVHTIVEKAHGMQVPKLHQLVIS